MSGAEGFFSLGREKIRTGCAGAAPAAIVRAVRRGLHLALTLALGCSGSNAEDAGSDRGEDAGGASDAAPGGDAGAPRDASEPSDAAEGAADAAADAGADAGVRPDAGFPADVFAALGPATVVADGFEFVEGPTWRRDVGDLLFSDIPGDTIFRLTPEGATPFRRPSRNANGLLALPDGTLYAAEHGARRVSRSVGDGAPETLVERFEGRRLNSPNDLARAADGTLYFTDPPYGIFPGDEELDFNGIYRVTPAGELVAEWRGGPDTRPNGIGLSPDGGTLYMSNTANGQMFAFDVAADGTLSNERRFAVTEPIPDGMCLDVLGNIYLTTRDGVQVFLPDGTSQGVLPIPEPATNCTFGGPDGRTLYITATSRLYAAPAGVAGW